MAQFEDDVISQVEIDAREGHELRLFAHVAKALYRIAMAQEMIADIMKADMTEIVEAAAQDRSTELANEIVESQTKRKIIGKRPA